jgi:hypothetical protein
MKYSKLMKERVRRVNIIMRELGFDLLDGEYNDDTYSAGFENHEGFQGGIFIDRDSKFLELAYTFSFSHNLSDFVQCRLEEMLQICYEYGCYSTVQTTAKEISFSVFSKIYYAGLNYYSLKETIRDYREAVDSLVELLEPGAEFEKGADEEDE